MSADLDLGQDCQENGFWNDLQIDQRIYLWLREHEFHVRREEIFQRVSAMGADSLWSQLPNAGSAQGTHS